MEVLLLTDIAGIGKRNDLVVVKDGFALNNLLPLRRALVVTPRVRMQYAEHIKKRALEREREREMLASSVETLRGKSVRIEAKANKSGSLYSAISAKMISDAILKQFETGIKDENIEIANPIKTVGRHTVVIRFGAESTTLPVDVVAMAESKEKAGAKKKAA